MVKRPKARLGQTSVEARFVKRAAEALETGDPMGSERLGLRVLAGNRFNADAWIIVGEALLARDEPDRAIKHLANALVTVAPKVRLLAFLYAITCHKLGQPEASKPWLSFIAMDPTLWRQLGEETDFALVQASTPSAPDWRPELG